MSAIMFSVFFIHILTFHGLVTQGLFPWKPEKTLLYTALKDVVPFSCFTALLLITQGFPPDNPDTADLQDPHGRTDMRI